MTRIVLLLTAIPLAAVLALVFNTLLDRRLAALEAPSRRALGAVPRRGLSIALAIALGALAMPALAESTDQACASIDCSLFVEAERVDELWRSDSNDGPALVAQSRIPVAFDPALGRLDAGEGDVMATDRSSESEPTVEPSARP